MKRSWPVSCWFTDVLYLLQLINKYHAANPFTNVNIFSVPREIPASLTFRRWNYFFNFSTLCI